MNTHPEYSRQPRQLEITAGPQVPTPEDVSHPARHGDPSLVHPGLATPTGQRIAWMRPTDLHSYAGAVIGRGIDLQAELTRRAGRAPHTLARSARRAAPDVSRRGPATQTSQEGLQL